MTAGTLDKPAARKPREKEPRQPEFVVRAKTGPSGKDWTTLGYAWKRERGDGFSIKLNALPIGSEWGGVLKLLPPFSDENDGPDDGAP